VDQGGGKDHEPMDALYVSAALIQEKPYERNPGTVCEAPYVDVGICALASEGEVRFRARIDTGADITCIPKDAARKLRPLLMGRPLLIRGHDGGVQRTRTYLMVVMVYGWPEIAVVRSYRPRRGVILTDSDIGLVGMDIVSQWDVSLERDPCRFSVVVL
jgi:hypothetical protein